MATHLTLTERRTPASLLARLGASLRSYTIGPMSLKDPALAKYFGASRRTTSGITVTDEMAFTFSAVLNAVDQISSDIAKAPLNLRKRDPNGGSQEFATAKLYYLLKNQPNPDMSSFVFRRTLVAHALTCHGGYAEIERDGTGAPSALWILTPDRVAPFLEKTTLANGRYRARLRYRIDGQTILDARDVLHLHGLGYDGYCGYPLINKARQAIGLALAAEQFGSSFFGNGTTFGGILSTDQPIGPDEEAEVRESVESYHSRADRAYRLLFLSGGWTYTPTGTKPNEAQMNELRDKQVEEIARFFNMPLHKLKLNKPGAVSYASVEMADLDYYKGCLLNWFVNCEQEYNRKLIPALEARQQFFKHNVDVFLRGDISSRYTALGIARDKGIINADEWRELEDMNPQPNGQGKIYLVQAAQVPVDQLSALVASQITNNTTPPAPPSAAPDPKRDQTLIDAVERAARAEAVAREAQAVADQATAAADAARANEAVSQEARTVADATAAAAQREATASQALALTYRAEADAHRMQAEDIARQLADESTARLSAEQTATLAVVAKEAADVVAAAAQMRADQAALAAQAAETDVATWRATAAQDGAARADALAALAAAEQVAEAARAEAAASRQDAVTAAQQQQDAQAEVARARADAETARTAAHEAEAKAVEHERLARATTDHLASVTALSDADRAAQQHAVDALTAALAALEQERATLHAATAAAIAEAQTAKVQLAAREQEMIRTVDTVRQADAEALSTSITAHRDLIVDIMRRAVERETDRARRAHTTPDKFAKWLDAFYEGHGELMQTALLPAMRVHLAFVRSDDDPIETTRRAVETHIRASERHLRACLEDDDVTFSALMNRWERERPSELADRLMRKELDYARRI